MTIDDVMREVAEIKAIADDYEKAHGREDALRASVLRAIAEHPECPSELKMMALAALAAEDLDFYRRCV